jgi:hypothetical protein
MCRNPVAQEACTGTEQTLKVHRFFGTLPTNVILRKRTLRKIWNLVHMSLMKVSSQCQTTSQGMIFVICFDKFDTLKAMKKPNLAPAFVKTFMKSLNKANQEQGFKETTQEQYDSGEACQGEAGVHSTRFKKAYFVTGTIGHIFYKLAKSLAPTHITDRIVEVRSREDAAKLLVKDGVIEEKNVPTFLGGSYLQDEITRKEYHTMMKAVTKEMRTKAGNLSYHW